MTLPCVCELIAGGKNLRRRLWQLFELTNKGARRIQLRASSQKGLQNLYDLNDAASGGMAVPPDAPASFTCPHRRRPASKSNIQEPLISAGGGGAEHGVQHSTVSAHGKS